LLDGPGSLEDCLLVLRNQVPWALLEPSLPQSRLAQGLGRRRARCRDEAPSARPVEGLTCPVTS
jgi:hypothetical protein